MNLDVLIFQQINGLAGRWNFLDGAGIFFAQYFEYALVGFTLFFLRKNFRVILSAFSAAVLARFGIVELIRLFWSRARPFIGNNVNLLIGHENTSSFPSGHAAFYFGLATVVYFYNKKAGIAFFAASFLVSIARIFVGVHWPTDVLGGAIVGILSGWLVLKVFKK
ncbi:MAG: PAP2 (Type 2 phosphatidic acid phosphatase) family protein [Parcubacteria group bacterium GW2011_GWB1_43_6]|nr:MAG: PAP2 (Type 2 phosphatidic acid phosphatase) family protein [Parcubacteria group bacterium GW2011_GWB1_43_6]